MIDEFVFDASPWELYARKLKPGDRVSAAELLTMLEGYDDDALEDAFETLEDLGAQLDTETLPKVELTGEIGKRLVLEERLAKQKIRPSDLPEGDPLRLFLEEVAAIPVCGDEEVLALELAEANRQGITDEGLQTRLMNLSLSRVVELACEYRGVRGVLLLDLIQEGSMGLWQGIRCYHRGDYAAHRDRWIRFYLAKAVFLQARASGVGQKMRSALEDYRAVDERLLGELGRNPTIEEIALELHMTAEEAAVVKKTLDNARLVASAKKPEPEEAEETEEDSQAVEDTAYFQMRQRIADLLSGLEEQDRKLLTLRFGLEGGKPLSPEETGRQLGLTPDEVVAREGAALAKLRNG